MKKFYFLLIVAFMILFSGCSNRPDMTIKSPNGNVMIQFKIEDGKPYYRVKYNKKEIVAWSKMGFRFKYNPNLNDNLKIINTEETSENYTWEPVWGQQSTIRDNYNQLVVKLKEVSELERFLDIYFRAYNDGVGFRYILPEQTELKRVEITAEETEFKLNKDNLCWWIPANYDSYELLYRETALKEVDSVNTPITMKTAQNTYLSIHEAALTDYAGMTLKNENGSGLLACNLVPWPDGVKVKAETPIKTPWRTIQLGKKPGDLIESSLIVNLNEPSKISDTEWIQPMKYTGIWWGMHIDKFTWHAGEGHGATTQRAMDLIDFNAAHNIRGLLVEGWNPGWESWLSGNNVQIYTRPYEDFDIEDVVEYAREKGVSLIGHHESGGNVPMYEGQLHDAFQYYDDLGINAVKTGYAGEMKPAGMHHHGQWMVNHYRKVLKLAASHRIMINAHEPIKPTGIRRTWPNMMTREGVRGMEYNAWSPGNPPEHTTILPFTRVLGGPVDYTPGIFDLTFEDYKPDNRVYTTLAKQLAYYVILYSPIQMAADLPENYDHPGFKFIEDVPVDWDTTKVIDARIGDYVVTARKAEDEWYLGGITDENPRQIEIPLNFLEDRDYVAEIYCDAQETGLYENPAAIEINQYRLTGKDKIQAALSTSGGIAIRIIPSEKLKKTEDIQPISKYNAESPEKMQMYQQLQIYKK